jgi:predicted RNA binding protein YcfA (HicA-like mRNA interferase family)
MGQGYYRVIKTKKLIALLVRQGFVSSGGSKHGKYVKEGVDGAIIVPRHRTISPGTSKQLCDCLEKLYGMPKSELKKIF